MAINVNEDGVLKPLNIETTGWSIKGLDFLGELIWDVPGKSNNVVKATTDNPFVTIKGEVITDSYWFALNLDRPLGDYKYIIFIPESHPGSSEIGYCGTLNGAKSQLLFPMLFNPTEMWRVWHIKGFTTRPEYYGFPIHTAHPAFPWIIVPQYSASYLMNELNDNVLYTYKTSTYGNWYLTVLGLR